MRALHGGLVCRATEDSEGSERVRRQQQRERADVVVRDEQADPNGDKLQHRNRDCGGLEQQGSGNRDGSPSTVHEDTKARGHGVRRARGVDEHAEARELMVARPQGAGRRGEHGRAADAGCV
ncbi:MAG: hypothetical protein AAGM22_32735, partial [Acidobacteriota bacterium]